MGSSSNVRDTSREDGNLNKSYSSYRKYRRSPSSSSYNSSRRSRSYRSRSRTRQSYRSKNGYKDEQKYDSRYKSRDSSSYKPSNSRNDLTGDQNAKDSKKVPTSRQPKKSAWDSMMPVSNLSAELCDTHSLNENKAKGKHSSSSQVVPDSQQCRIYIGSLDPDVKEEDIRTIFSSFGEITCIEMPRDPSTNKSKGYCFVEYRKKESADVAIVSMQGFQIKGRPIKLGKPNAATGQGSVFSAGMGMASMSAAYTNPFANPMAAGVLAAAAFLQSRSGVKIDTCMFSKVVNKRDVAVILSKIGASASIPFSIGPTPPEMNGKRVHLENVPFELGSQDIKKIFEPFGTIINCVLIPRDMLPGSFYGCGYIDFESPQVAQIVSSAMNGFEIAGAKVQVTMAPSSLEPSNVIVLCNMVDPKLVDEELPNEVKEECSKYGTVTSVYLHFSQNDSISIFVVFNTHEDAENAVKALNSRWFNGRQIECRSYDSSAYFSGNYDL
ncbi:RNA recognition motif domain-containing protein [Theileria equi strain WA]|uniref:RNA recognition motif domain-containing protein n=1 Tax=Theileria equi strain WA TaxID=1537102 RepID=L0B1J2_THEEQ|nr:RNA recognition motif domain-containing protein [Theileria equi strain WA]AFZ81363.1 RNA recognition motif domain-containing protein [Theileria equi strain WA]|eukprot:XP_004831029.1 RNA recognition motif domain-containing protein [Theileria equi strain WA]